jgi:superfamily I DNA and/or RNA helicase
VNAQITILSPYLDQFLAIRERVRQTCSDEQRVRVENVDNYQGEECDIIILSLVRSNNAEGKIGHLKVFFSISPNVE